MAGLKLFIAVLCLFFAIDIVSASDTEFININSLHGISIREANSIRKDDVGFIWASSKTGILRLTEDDYRIYQLPYQTADVISVELEYRDKQLMAYTNNGQIFSYNPLNDKFEFHINMNVLLNNRHLSLSRMLIDLNGDSWIASSAGLYKYHNDTISFAGSNASMVNFIEWYNDSILFKVQDNSLSFFNINTLQSEKIHSDNESFSASNMHFDENANVLWIGTISNGLFYFDLSSGLLKQYMSSEIPRQPVMAIESVSDSAILIGVDGQGIWELSKQKEQILNVYKECSDNPSSLRGNGVYDILDDKAGRVWVCTYSGGVSYFKRSIPLVEQVRHVANNPNSLINNDVNHVLEDTNGNIWFATNNGLSFWQRGINQWKTFFHNTEAQAQVFLSLCEDDAGRIWAGTYSTGYYVIDPVSGKDISHTLNKSDIQHTNNFVFDIYKDSQGDVWIGGVQDHLVCYIASEDRFRTYSQFPLYVIREQVPGTLLMGCTFGLLSLNKQTGEAQTLISGYLVNDILVLENHIWIATIGDGLLQYNTITGTVTKFTVEHGLPSNFVKAVSFAHNYLWLGTENGLCRFDPYTYTAQTYESLHALSSVAYNQGSHGLLQTGELIMGTNNGAVIFNPSEIEPIKPEGRIFIQDLIVAGRSVRENEHFELEKPLDSIDQITLNYTHNTITLEYLPLGISTAGAKYSWKLEGHDSHWSQATSNRSFTYANIPNGEFMLRIRMHDPSMTFIVDERQIKLKILPPFWQTWWFNSIILFLVIGSSFFALIYYVNQLKKKHSEDKIRFFASTAHDLRTALTLISAPIQELEKEKQFTENGKYYLNLASEQTKRLMKVSTQLLDFQKTDTGRENLNLTMSNVVKLVKQRTIMFRTLAQQKNIQLIFNSNTGSYTTAIDEPMIEKVVDNLISNAIKYSHPNAQVQINLQCKPTGWVFEVLDQGIGIGKKAQSMLFNEFYRGDNAINSKVVGSGIGLLLSKNYILLHGGKISCESIENKGSVFRVSLPYKQVLSESENAFEISDELKPESLNIQAEKKAGNKNMRILLAEDNDDLRTFMQLALQHDFEILTARDGKLALDLIRKDMPDLVISDVMMPRMSGFELCEQMKSNYETSHIPVILLTALTDKDNHMHGLGLGADDYLTKPFDMALLVQKIKTIVRNRKNIHEKAFRLINEEEREPLFENKLNDEFVKKAVEVVKNNLSNQKFGKDDFAFEMNVSSSLLYKKIKALTDQSPSDFIKSIRMNSALNYLKSGKYTVTEVSEMCGFASVSYFSSVFKKYFGKSPKSAQ